MQAEDRIFRCLDRIEHSGKRFVDHGAGIGQVHALSDAVGSASPAGIDEPAFHIVLFDLLTEQIGIDIRMMYHKRRAEACREIRLGRRHSALCSGKLCRITGDKMIERLLFCQARDWRQNAECIGS